MKKKKMRPFSGICIFLLSAAILLGGWYALENKQALSFAKETSYSVSTNLFSDVGYFSEEEKTVAMSAEDVHRGSLILVNHEHACQTGGSGDLVSLYGVKNDAYQVSGQDVLLSEKVAVALGEMMADFGRGGAVNIISGYRTQDEQQSILDERVASEGEVEAARWVAKPGFSEHHTGLALDLGLYFGDGTSATFDGEGEFAWVAENCWKYGFIVRYPMGKENITKIAYEPWHLRYVGVPHAFLMKKMGFCLEEYIHFLREYPAGEKHLEVAVNNLKYEIYFANEADVLVPANGSYEISGNNVDGFIVTTEK